MVRIEWGAPVAERAYEVKLRGFLVDPVSGDVTAGALAEEIGRLRRHQIIALAYANTFRREAAGQDADTRAEIDAVANRVASVEKQLAELRRLTERIADALGPIRPIGDISLSQSTKDRLDLDGKRRLTRPPKRGCHISPPVTFPTHTADSVEDGGASSLRKDGL